MKTGGPAERSLVTIHSGKLSILHPNRRNVRCRIHLKMHDFIDCCFWICEVGAEPPHYWLPGNESVPPGEVGARSRRSGVFRENQERFKKEELLRHGMT